MSAALTDVSKSDPPVSLDDNVEVAVDGVAPQTTEEAADELKTGTTPDLASNEQILQTVPVANQEPKTDIAALVNAPTEVNATSQSIFSAAAGKKSPRRPKNTTLASLFAPQARPASQATRSLIKPQPAAPPPEAANEADADDEPAGLMKLISAPGMARMAVNGLWVQTDRVDTHCFKPDLIALIHQIEKHYGKPAVVTSGFRSLKRNRRAGGSSFSRHTTCDAADIQVADVSKWELAEYLRSLPNRGGVGTYCHTKSVHIDTGMQRDWNWRCRRR